MTSALVILGFLFFTAFFLSCSLFDTLLAHRYECHRASWREAGAPLGVFWQSEERGSRKAGWILLLRLILGATPRWLDGDPDSAAVIRKLRLLSLVGFLAWIGFLVTVYVISRG